MHLGAAASWATPAAQKMQSVMNLKIKFRESFRPFAPIVLREHVDRYFEMRPGEDSPYMLLVAPVREEHPHQRWEQITSRRSASTSCTTAAPSIPAVTHVDYSARVQTVDAERNPLLHKLMTRFYEKTGCPVLINTSFNVRGEPIVCTPEDAYRCFHDDRYGCACTGSTRPAQGTAEQQVSDADRQEHLAQFQLD